MNNKKDRKAGLSKTTNEQPVSLHPLEFEDALEALLQTPPKPANGTKSKKPTPRKDK